MYRDTFKASLYNFFKSLNGVMAKKPPPRLNLGPMDKHDIQTTTND